MSLASPSIGERARATDAASPARAPGRRIDSIDVFRGLTMFLMLFVNDLNDPDLGNVRDVPAWLRHMPATENGMTFVDVIMPAFLFSVGLSIPFALGRRIDQSRADTWKHVLLRTLGLIVIGLCMVNTYRFHPTAMPVSPAVWEFLFFASVIMIWNRYPREAGVSKSAPGLRVAGIVVLAVLVVIFRGDQNGEATWMRTSWWGILTMIGVAYLVASAAYIGGRKSIAVLAVTFCALTVVNLGSLPGGIAWIRENALLRAIAHMAGALGSITVAGVIVTVIRQRAPEQFARWALTFAAGTGIAGAALYAPHGVSKSSGTPAWCLFSIALCVVIFLAIDRWTGRRGVGRLSRLVRPAGVQSLLAYVLPHLFYSALGILGIVWLQENASSGFVGITRSFVLACVFVATTHLLTRRALDFRL